jgi:hypothetical protein
MIQNSDAQWTYQTSQAFLEASSSASRDDMRALAADKASVAQKRGKKVE